MKYLSREYAIQTDRELVRKGGLYDFVGMAWREIESTPFTPNWHLEEICIHLEAVSRCEIRDLVINIPPGCGKSLTLNILWPAWEWIFRPETRWIYASFDASLVGQRDGDKLINLLKSDWFVSRWGNLLPRGNLSASNFNTVKGGSRFSTSPGGKGTGRHPNITCVDDSVKPLDVAGGGSIERKALKKCSDWWANTMSSRQADPKTHRKVVMGQRVHKNDLPGECINAGYEVLRLPMRYEPAFHCRTVVGGDRRTKEGELLFPDRFDEIEVAKLEKNMGPTVAAAQLQQRPTVEGGGIFKREFWQFWHYMPNVPEPCLHEKCFNAQKCVDPEHVQTRFCVQPPPEGFDVQAWDMSFKGQDGSDFVAGGLWRCFLGEYFLLDLLNDRMSYAVTKETLKLFSKKWPSAYNILVEDAANGPAIISDLCSEYPGLTPVPTHGGHLTRANAVSPLFAAKKVYIPHPEIFPLIWHYMSQLEGFPRDTHDDLVDMTSHPLVQFRQHGIGETFSKAMARLRGDK